jgi:hypothetical protein
LVKPLAERCRRQLAADEQLRCADDLLSRGRRAEHLIRPCP